MRGDRLKKLRTNRKLTQEELGKLVNVTKVSISGYENGHRSPDTDTLQKLADTLDTSTDYILGRTESPDLSNNKKSNQDYPSWGDEAEFEAWVNDPTVNKFYKEFNESPEERKKALLAVWEILKTQGK